MPRGGYQKPKNPAPVSGPGRFSRRTDGKITEPDIDKERGLQYGDRKMLVDAQRIAKTAVGAGARAGGASRQLSGAPPTRGKLPPWLTQTPDTNPSEPTTAGLDMGAGPGSEVLDASQPTDDVRVVVMQFIADTYGNPAAVKWLADHRTEMAAQAQAEQAPALEPMTGDGLSGLE